MRDNNRQKNESSASFYQVCAFNNNNIFPIAECLSIINKALSLASCV